MVICLSSVKSRLKFVMSLMMMIVVLCLIILCLSVVRVEFVFMLYFLKGLISLVF